MIELMDGIHKVIFLFAMFFSAYHSRKELSGGNYAESLWWAWITTIVVVIG